MTNKGTCTCIVLILFQSDLPDEHTNALRCAVYFTLIAVYMMITGQSFMPATTKSFVWLCVDAVVNLIDAYSYYVAMRNIPLGKIFCVVEILIHAVSR